MRPGSAQNGSVPRIAAAVPLLVAALVLAGCVPQTAEPTGIPSPPSSTPTTTPSETPSSTPPPPDAGTPVPFGCAEVVTPDEMYAFNSIYSFVEYTPEASSLAGQAVAAGGIACRWVNTSSGIPIDFGFAQPSAAQLEQLESEAGAPAPFGYFETGTAQAFVGPYWVTAVSPDLIGADDAAPVIELAINSLG